MRRCLPPLAFLSALLAAVLTSPVALAQPDLRGHGGPVRALAITPNGALALSGSFDQSAILWSLERGRALAILRAHDGSVNAVAAISDSLFATGGEDGRVALWKAGSDSPVRIQRLHDAPVASLAVSRDGRRLASAGWDRVVVVTDVESGARLDRLEGHRDNVNAVAPLPDGGWASASYDLTLRLWSAGATAPIVVEFDTPLNALAVLPDGRAAVGGADGSVRIVSPQGKQIARIEAAPTPIIAIAVSHDGASIAAASPRGAVALINAQTLRVRANLTGPGLPVWSLAFAPDGHVLFTGGGDRLVRRWDARTGEHIGAVLAERPSDDFAALGPLAKTRGAEVYRACAVCHTLHPDDENRAGPTLYGVFGRKAGAAPGYNYSEAFRRLDLIWTRETISRLFEIGPQAYTPGTKMPEQTVPDADDRAALMDFLEAATKSRVR